MKTAVTKKFSNSGVSPMHFRTMLSIVLVILVPALHAQTGTPKPATSTPPTKRLEDKEIELYKGDRSIKIAGTKDMMAAAKAKGWSVTKPSNDPTEGSTNSCAGKRCFIFRITNIEASNPAGYRVEGITPSRLLFNLDCFPYAPDGNQLGDEEIEQYQYVEQFRKMAIERVDWASTTKVSPDPEMIILWDRKAHIAEWTKHLVKVKSGEEPRKVLDEISEAPFAQCIIKNRLPNGGELFPIKVISSEFRNWKDGEGYEMEAQTENEALTLACTEHLRKPTNSPVTVYRGQRSIQIEGTKEAMATAKKKGWSANATEGKPSCSSLPPSAYRATRGGSQVALYDSDLNLVGIYRIMREQLPQP